ncbi:MAG: PilZ domain-containing protein [Desulfuromusa sp.]|nr:PilZ domain-containing protein [Desulfuromusa sp.]
MSEVEQKNIARLGSMRQKQLFNQINALHYQGAPLIICMQHKNHEYCIYLKANPDPVSDERITATWIKDESSPAALSAFNLVKIILNTNRDAYEFKPEVYRISDRALSFTLPETAVKSGGRKQFRFTSFKKEIPITLTQNAIVFSGQLLDYSANGILVNLYNGESLSFAWLNNSHPAMLTIQGENHPVYTGQVSLSPRDHGQYLLTPNMDATPRYNAREYRSRRQQLVPSPDLIFDHPITGKKVRLKISDLSSLGFSVIEKASRASLIPGLLIKDAIISFTNNLLIPCMAQVVYCEPDEKEPGTVRVGFAILDITIQSHLQLINFVQQAQNSSTYISNQIDPEDLFDFFFETGFLYPKKYAEIANKREEMMQSYLALYQKGVDISRHFVYQHQGQIFGHFSALHVYRKTWFCQHHAALNNQRAGLKVLRAISEYINDSYQLNPINLKYIIGYYRDANKFPKRYFGDYVGELNDYKKTALDCYSYINEARRFMGGPVGLEKDWSLEPAEKNDLEEFCGYYKKTSEGMLPEALDLLPEDLGDQTMTEAYKANGLSRRRELLALRYQNSPKALIDIQSTGIGLNLSEITNAITVYLIDPKPEYFDMVRFAICDQALKREKASDPVMVFPNSFLNSCDFHVDKEYTMWTLNVPQGMESYMAWMNRFCR